MSNTIHKALVITTFCKASALSVIEKVDGLKLKSLYAASDLNGIVNIFIYPSGSNAGWEDDIAHAAKIGKAINFIEQMKYEDGSNSVSYVSLEYGDNGLETLTNCVDKIGGTDSPITTNKARKELGVDGLEGLVDYD